MFAKDAFGEFLAEKKKRTIGCRLNMAGAAWQELPGVGHNVKLSSTVRLQPLPLIRGFTNKLNAQASNGVQSTQLKVLFVKEYYFTK